MTLTVTKYSCHNSLWRRTQAREEVQVAGTQAPNAVHALFTDGKLKAGGRHGIRRDFAGHVPPVFALASRPLVSGKL